MTRPRQRRWDQEPETIERIKQHWAWRVEGLSLSVIAEKSQVSLSTVSRDLQRARGLMREAAGLDMAAKKAMAVADRRSMQAVALDNLVPGIVDASGRASLLIVVSKNQDAIEDLEGLRPRGGAVAGVRVRAGPGGVEVEAGVAVGRSLTEDILGDDEATEAALALTERLGRREVEPGRPGDGGKRRALGAGRPPEAP